MKFKQIFNTVLLGLTIFLTGSWLFATDYPTGGTGAQVGSANTWTADQTFNDNVNITLGSSGNVDIDYNGTNVVIDPQVSGTGHFEIVEGTTGSGAESTGILNLTTTDAGTIGAIMVVHQDSSTPGDNDIAFLLNTRAEDSGSTARTINQIKIIFDDITATEMDSSMAFVTMAAANGVNANTTATLNNIGEWTNASGADMKRYDPRSSIELFGNTILDKIALLPVGRWAHARTPIGKPDNTYSYGPTAEDFWDAFGLGKDPRKTDAPGIGTGAMSGILMAAVKELVIENEALKARLTAGGL